MARVADVRKLGLGSGPSAPTRHRGPVSRTGKNLTASLPRSSTDTLVLSRSSSEHTLRVPDQQPRLSRKGSWRPVSRGPHPLSFGPTVQFDEPVSDEARRAAHQHREKRGLPVEAAKQSDAISHSSSLNLRPQQPEEDLFAVLERRIAAQRSELRQHRADIKTAIEQDVQSIQEKWDQDRVELSDVHSQYRQALDELARLRGELSDVQITLEAAEAGWEDSKAESTELQSSLKAVQEARTAQVSLLEERLEELTAQKDREDSLQQLVEVLREGLSAAKVKGRAAAAAEMEVSALREKCASLHDARVVAERELTKIRAEERAEVAALREEATRLKAAAEEVEARREEERRASELAVAGVEKERRELAEERERNALVLEEARQAMETSVHEARREAEGERCAADKMREEAARLQQQLTQTSSALTIAREQLQSVEDDAQRVRQELVQMQERGCELARQLHVSEAEQSRLQEELAGARAATGPTQERREGDAMDEGSLTDEHRTVSSTKTVTTTATTTKDSQRSTSSLPEGGSVAQGVAVTVNYHSRCTIQSLQTTIREKEVVIVRLSSELAAAATELAHTKTYWKSSQTEASKLQSRLRTEQAARSTEVLELRTTLDASDQRLREETESSKRLAGEVAVLREEVRKSEQASEAAEHRVQALRGDVERATQRAAEAERGRREAEEEARGRRAEVEDLVAKVEQERAEAGQAVGALEREKSALEATWREQQERASRAAEEMEKRLGEVREEARTNRRGWDNAKWEVKRKEHQHAQALALEQQRLAEAAEERVTAELARRNRQLDAKERSFRCTVGKLLSAEEALESSLTCMGCLALMHSPVTCSPCGHSFCAACVPPPTAAGASRECLECGPGTPVEAVTPSVALDALCGKYAHRMHQLKELQKTLAVPAIRA